MTITTIHNVGEPHLGMGRCNSNERFEASSRHLVWVGHKIKIFVFKLRKEHNEWLPARYGRRIWNEDLHKHSRDFRETPR